jgi:putative oxidoreductase
VLGLLGRGPSLLRPEDLVSSPTSGSSLAYRVEAIVVPIAQLLTRIVFGQAFLLTGLGKLNDLPKVTQFFESLGVPAANVQAPMVAVIECAGGALLLLGLGTRIAAFLLTCVMVVALITAHPNELVDGLTGTMSFADVAPLPFLVGVLWLLALGAGKLSLDALIQRRRGGA